MKERALSLRTKLVLSFLAVIIVGGLISLIIGSRLVRRTLIGQAQLKVKHDLAAAWMVFNEKLNDIQQIVTLTASRESIQEALKSGNTNLLLRYLSRVRTDFGLDILTLTDGAGKVIIRTRNPGQVGDYQTEDELVRLALKGGIVASPQVVPAEQLQLEGEDLAAQAYLEFIPTPRAEPKPKSFEDHGFVIKAAASIHDESHRTLGVLYGGILLNRNYEIVDRIKETVFKGEKYKGRDVGTATIFLNDLRISTNVRNEKGERAIGTLLSSQVKKAVLYEGKAWIDRAFVVTDWYITAYEPIRNIEGKIIGILYVGMLEKPYIDTANKLMLTFTLMASLCVIFLLVILYFSTTQIIRPLQKMVTATEEIAKGDLSHKVDVRSKDELGLLASSFNEMIDQLRQANEALMEWGRTLEKKVEVRTRELTEMQSKLIQSEKLASLGKLAAGVAHEINNPLGAILIYSHLLLEDTPKNSSAYDNLRKIVKETSRCKDIVKGLLEFARPKEPEMVATDVNEIVDRALAIMEKQALFQNITVNRRYSSLPPLIADASQLQQVFMNIILNAAEAMNGQGTLTITTSVAPEDKKIKISFADTGHGIRPEDMSRLFEPFFTTKEVGKGTGLGLAISYSIIQKHKGTIEVASEPGKGSTFTVVLPLQEESDDNRKS